MSVIIGQLMILATSLNGGIPVHDGPQYYLPEEE